MPAPREFVFVDVHTADTFRQMWADIDRRFPALSPAPEGMSLEEHWRNLASLRQSARDDLRAQVREAASQGLSGLYPIAV